MATQKDSIYLMVLTVNMQHKHKIGPMMPIFLVEELKQRFEVTFHGNFEFFSDDFLQVFILTKTQVH